MWREDIVRVMFEEIELFGKKVLFTGLRIDKGTVPEGLYMYEVRHADEDWGEPCQLCDWVMINFYGTIISDEQFELVPNKQGTNAYREINGENDWIMSSMSYVSLEDYMTENDVDHWTKPKNDVDWDEIYEQCKDDVKKAEDEINARFVSEGLNNLFAKDASPVTEQYERSCAYGKGLCNAGPDRDKGQEVLEENQRDVE